ncbi:MAG: trypsin-like serine protease [Aeoliella sp.]
MKLSSRLFAFTLACLFVSCSQVIAQSPVARIINGQPTGEFDSVGIVGSTQAGGFCTGTLISPIHVITAGHCAQFVAGDTDATFEVGGQAYSSTRIDIHPGFDPLTLENDIAIIELSQSVVGVEPSQIFRGTPLVGDELTIVGFGAGGTPAAGAQGAFGEKRVGVTFIDEVSDLFVSWVFDSADESNTAPGDSGGPGFIDVAGEMFIASITSGGTNSDASLGDLAFNTRVDTFTAWIDPIIAVDIPPVDGPPTDGPPINEPPTDAPPTDQPPTDQPPTDEQPTDQGDCPSSAVRDIVRQIFSEIFAFLASDSFVSLLQQLSDELAASGSTSN